MRLTSVSVFCLFAAASFVGACSSSSGGLGVDDGGVAQDGGGATGGTNGRLDGGPVGNGGSGGGHLCPAIGLLCRTGEVVGTGADGCPACVPGKGTDGGVMCGPVCDIFCPNGNVVDGNGCPTCTCNPQPMACAPSDCGVMNFALPLCSDGKPATTSCTRNPSNMCSWVVSCDRTTTCQPADCGAVPPIAACPLNSTGGQLSCAQDPSSGKCVWNVSACEPIKCPAVACLVACPYGAAKDDKGCTTCQCLPPTCDKQECPAPPPLAVHLCDDGSASGVSCKRDSSGMCGWSADPCPPACSTVMNAPDCGKTMGCQWVEPGCQQPTIPAAACFNVSDLNCKDNDCRNGKQCLKRTVSACPTGQKCNQCAVSEAICL